MRSEKMYSQALKTKVQGTLADIRAAGLYKEERPLVSTQGPRVRLSDGRQVLNFCSNNYLGLSNDIRLVSSARSALAHWGFGVSSVRFICGTQTVHKKLEKELAAFMGTEDAILYGSCFDANGGLFETLLGPEDAVISDELNHASIIDGIRLCKAQRFRYKNRDMADLEAQLKAAAGAKVRLIATDGVFSMEGTFAPLNNICDLAEKYDAAVMIDDSHATGFIGQTGRGTHEFFHVMDRVDIITSTLGKALGGASGGFTAGRAELIELLRQRSRPYLFSNSLAPVIAGTSLMALEILKNHPELREKLMYNNAYFRQGMVRNGFKMSESVHPIVPIMLGGAQLAQKMAAMMMDEGIYVRAFSYPVVPQDKARIRVQISAAHEREDLDRAIEAFKKVFDACAKGGQ